MLGVWTHPTPDYLQIGIFQISKGFLAETQFLPQSLLLLDCVVIFHNFLVVINYKRSSLDISSYLHDIFLPIHLVFGNHIIAFNQHCKNFVKIPSRWEEFFCKYFYDSVGHYIKSTPRSGSGKRTTKTQRTQRLGSRKEVSDGMKRALALAYKI